MYSFAPQNVQWRSGVPATRVLAIGRDRHHALHLLVPRCVGQIHEAADLLGSELRRTLPPLLAKDVRHHAKRGGIAIDHVGRLTSTAPRAHDDAVPWQIASKR